MHVWQREIMGLLREGPAAPKNLLPVFSDLDPGITLSSCIKEGSSLGFWAGFWKKGALFEGRETPHTGWAQGLRAASENIPVVEQRDTHPWAFQAAGDV